MSRKKNQKVVIPDEELKPTVLYTIKERKTNFIGLILLVGLFVAVIYFLPEAYDMYDKYRKEKQGIPVLNNKKPQGNTVDDNPGMEEEVKYEFSNTLKISNDDITLNSFNFGNNTLSFMITNNKNTNESYKDKNYYLEIYNDSDVLVKRIKIAEDVLSANGTQSYSYQINATTISYLYLKEIKKENYATVTLNENSEKIATIVCKNNEETLTYTFNNKELATIKDEVSFSNTISNYSERVTNYRSLYEKYRGYDLTNIGVGEMFGTFTFNIEMDLSKVNVANFSNNNYYVAKTSADVVNFEVEARGYSCS